VCLNSRKIILKNTAASLEEYNLYTVHIEKVHYTKYITNVDKLVIVPIDYALQVTTNNSIIAM